MYVTGCNLGTAVMYKCMYEYVMHEQTLASLCIVILT